MAKDLFRDPAHLDMVLLLFAVLVMPAFSAMSGARLARTPPAQRKLLSRYWQTIARGWIVAAVLIAYWHWMDRPFARLGLDWPIGISGWLGFGLDVILAVALVINAARLRRVLRGDLDKWRKWLAQIKMTPRTEGQLALFMLVSVTAGVWEELLYRGFLIWFLAPSVGLPGAAIVSSVIFGLAHAYQGWRGVVVTAAVGLSLAIMYLATKSLWWLMLAHALVDINGGVVAFRLARWIKERDSASAAA
ncbi:MAG TPA: CPBP family intramembrane glutamic endopeptidase [Rhizomicrobium sp.]|jgi:membrane protease YdiL (CAAX protease family)